jgi:hypothetical protein
MLMVSIENMKRFSGGNLYQIGNPCGYSNSTFNKTSAYPYLYWPAPNLNFNASSTDPMAYLSVFAYSSCVSSCPTNTSAFGCVQPNYFNANSPGKFANCTYYPAGTSFGSSGAFRYGTTLCKSYSFDLDRCRLVLPT